MKMSLSKEKKQLPSERSTPSPSLKVIQNLKNKIFSRELKLFNQFKEQYKHNWVNSLITRDPMCTCFTTLLFSCTCVNSLDSRMIYFYLRSECANMRGDEYKDYLSSKCFDEDDDRFAKYYNSHLERFQLFAYIYAAIERFRASDELTKAFRKNINHIYRAIKTVDGLFIEYDKRQLLYKCLKSVVGKLDLHSRMTLNQFMTKIYLCMESFSTSPDLSYVPDLVMTLNPEMLAQVGDDIISRQSIRDKIDSLIRESDTLLAESFFGVDVNIPESTTATLLSIITELRNSVKDILITSFKFSMLAIAAVVYLITAYLVIHRIVTMKPRYLAAIHIICALAIMYNDETSVIHSVMSWCKSKFSVINPTERVAEAGFVNTNILSFIPLFIIQTMNIPVKIGEKLITSKFLDSLGRKISFLGDSRFYAGVNNISEWIQKSFEIVKSHFYEWLGLEYVSDLSSEKDSVYEWTEKCEKVITDYYNRSLLFSESERSYITSLYSEGCRLARHPVYKSAAYEIHNTCRNILIIVEKINNKLNLAGSLRNPPVTLMLHGDTGAGKSSLTYPLAVAILLEIYKREGNEALKEQLRNNCHRLIYTRNSEQEYWDGYTGQTVCVFDDWNQLVDSASNPSQELFELIRASNVFPYPLHMAHLEDKASVNFSSDIIICSSNNKTPKVESLNFPKALIRRFTKFVHVSRKLNVDNKFSFDSYFLTPYNPETLDQDGSLTIQEFVSQVVDEYMCNKGFVSSINDFVEGLLAQSDNDDAQPDRQSTCNLFTRIYELDFKTKVSDLKEKYSWLLNFNFGLMIGAASLIGAGILVYQYFSSDKPSAESTPISEYVEARVNNRAARRRIVDSEAYETLPKRSVLTSEFSEEISEAYEPIVKKNTVVTEACIDLVSTEMGGKVARLSLYRMALVDEDVVTPLGHCLFLKGNVAICPLHFVYVINSKGPNASLYFSSLDVDKIYPIRARDLVFKEYIDKYGRSKDIASFQLPHARQHADISTMFAPGTALRSVLTTKVCMTMLHSDSPKRNLVLDRHIVTGASCVRHLEDPQTYTLTSTGQKIKIHDAWEYSLETQPGDCGAPLFALNEKIAPGKIIGIHVAGSKGVGMSTVFFQEDAQAICESYRLFAQVNTLRLKEGINPYPDCEMVYLGDLDKPVIQPVKSKIVPSVVYSKVTQPTTDKTWLRPGTINGETFDPMDYRMRRMGKASVLIPFDIVDLAQRGLLNEFKRVYLAHEDSLVGRFKCPYTLEETCIGVPGEEFVNAVKRDTSAGFPFVQMGITRSQIFGTDMDYDLKSELCQDIFKLVYFYEECASEGDVLDHYSVLTLKDERKPIEKAHKTRMFSAGPIDYLIWSKRWFNGVVAIISELRNKIHISVGTNVYSNDWHFMTEGLLRKSTYFVAGDFEGFDASEQAYILKAAINVLIDFSQFVFGKDEFARVQMEAISVGLLHSYQVSGKHVFQWLKSLPSGHYLTAIANSCFVLLSLSSAYLLAKQKLGNRISSLDVAYFWDHFGVVAYGDDHVIAVPPECLSFYNQNTLVELLREFGLYYTDERKTGSFVPDSRPIEEIAYLKRGFYYHSELGRWLAPLDLQVVLETPMWIRANPDPHYQTFSNIEFSLRELSLHPQETWDEWAPKLLSLCEKECKLVSKFNNKTDTLLFVLDLDLVIAQCSDVIFENDSNKRGFKRFQLLSGVKTGDIYPYHTGSVQANPDYPVTLARQRREGALVAQSFSPAENTTFNNNSTNNNNTNEVRDRQYQDQTNNDLSQQITTFENDLSIVEQDVPSPTLLDIGLRSMHSDNAHHSIVSFLQRPMVLREFSWTSDQGRGSDVFTKIRVPFDMLVRQFRDKLQGFMSFRATAVIKVQFQTQPFQAGRFLMAAVPVPNLIGKRTKLIEGRLSNLTLLNHVQADIAKQTEVTLRVPYISPLIAYDLVQGRYDWAEIVGKVYSPVSSVGNTSVEGIVYVHFEDIQLGAPTSMPMVSEAFVAQSGDSFPTNQEPGLLTDIRQRAKENGITASSASKTTGGLRKVNKAITKYLPFTAPVTNVLDKFLLEPADDLLGPLLNIFGFSKPITVADDKLLRPTTNFSTLMGTDRALTLATSEDVNAPFLPHLNGTGLDEMSFDFLKKIPQFVDFFNYSTTNNKNDCLYSFNVRPTFSVPEQLRFSYQTTSKNISQPTHLAYICEPFAYWTGSLILTLKFVKTDYHSGRVEVSYHPNCDPQSGQRVVKEGVDFDMAYRYIIDLREKSEVSLRIPYMAVTPFKRNIYQLFHPSEHDMTRVEINSGCVIVRALTPLKASNAVVSNMVEVLVEYNAGNDFQVMNPVTCRYNPVTPLENSPSEAETWSGYDSDSVYSNVSWEAQSGEASSAGLAITRQQAIEGEDPPSITHNDGEVRSISSTFAVTGEKFYNFRDLCHRSNFVLKVEDQGFFSEALHRLYAPPPFTRAGASASEFGGFYLQNRANSALAYVGSMYALSRGSVNVRILPTNFSGFLSGKLFTDQSTPTDCLFPRAIENCAIKGLAEFHIPYYCRTYQFDHLKYDKSELYDLNIGVAVPVGQKITASAAISGGDDISFGYFVGTPVVLFPSITLSSGGADPFDHSSQDPAQSAIVSWDEISIV
uniref:Genome polyprotein n=1 Tax=Anagyrus vladimiri dicistrovirus TaxID=2992172 RepID=A0A9E7VEJ8_9VIRU|nr:polyprotein [Anagyrus vladimiri dicistrovirus]